MFLMPGDYFEQIGSEGSVGLLGENEYMGYLLYILPPISFIMGIWRIVSAIKHCHDPDFTIQLMLGFFLILASVVFFFCNIVTLEFNVIPPAGY